MEGFKKIVKMKTGGSVSKAVAAYEKKEGKKEESADIAQDKAIVKKAFSMHDKQEHKGEKTDLSKLKQGGRAKKECGTVKKYKKGGAIVAVSATANKKAKAPSKAAIKAKGVIAKPAPSGDMDPMSNIPAALEQVGAEAPAYKCGGGVYGAKKTKEDIKNIDAAKTCKPKMAGGGGVIDAVKSAGKSLYENVMGTPEQNKTAQESMDKQAAKGSKLAKFFGGKAEAESAPVAKKRGGKC